MELRKYQWHVPKHKPKSQKPGTTLELRYEELVMQCR